MKWKASSLIPVLICGGVIALTCFIEALGEMQPRFQRLEWMTYDWRVREAARSAPPAADHLGFAAIDDDSLDALINGSLPYRFGLLWPRQIYARLVDELSAQGARAVGFDVLFAELRPDHPPAEIDHNPVSSDEFFARALRRSSNVVLASEGGSLFPPELFATNALAVAHISTPPDRDGILRRSHAFLDVRVWHAAIRSAAGQFGWKLDEARIESNHMLFPRRGEAQTDSVPLSAQGHFNAGALERAVAGNQGALVPRFEKPFEDKRLWQLGLVLAARELDLDLNQPLVDLAHGRIVLSNARGVRRTIRVDGEGRFLIDWSIGLNDPRLTREKIESLLTQYEARRAGHTNDVTERWRGKLAVVGSIATGNNLNDFGATPLEEHTYLVSSHWNVANSLLQDRFPWPLPWPWRFLIIAVFGAIAGLCTWNLRILWAVLAVAGLALAYIAVSWWLFNASRLWLPIITPVLGSLLVTEVCLIAYLVRVESRAGQRTREIFSRVVSPEIVRELLDAEKLSLSGRRHVTIFFADIRGFTSVTDASQRRAERLVAEHNLTGRDAESRFDSEAECVLNTVNPYLCIVADIVKKHRGTLDKYIGDCVMAFWGAPIPTPGHAAHCVRAVIEAQRAVFEFNLQRQAENARREEENIRRQARGEELLPALEILTLGSGINTGVVTVGTVGSETHFVNYTVFGREVNLASRLEGASGRARILISEATYLELERDDPELATTCREQEPLLLKGFADAVKAYEVPWRSGDMAPADAGQSQTIIRNQAQRDDPY